MSEKRGYYLFATNVGSTMWGMQHSKSDIDLFTCYIYPNYDILTGREKPDSFHRVDEKGWELLFGDTRVDNAGHEIGKVIHQLLKSNVNFLWGIMSPIQYDLIPEFDLAELRGIVQKNLSKQVYHSINGLAVHNYQKYFVYKSLLSEKDRLKKARIILRTLNFGIRLLDDETFVFDKEEGTEYDIPDTLRDLKEAYEDTNLPAIIPNPEEFYAFLWHTRKTLGGE